MNVDFAFPASGVTGLFGPSGSGKTTLLRCAAGLSRASGGFMEFNGETWQDDNNNFFIPAHQRRIGYVFQDARLFWHLNVKNNIEFGYNRIPEGERILKPDEVVEWLSLGHLLDRYPERLSGGEKQRVAMARAILTNPKLMLFDEPLASLDDDGKREIMRFLEVLHEKLSIPSIYVTHSIGEIQRLADYLALIKDGAIYAHGPLNEVITNLNLPLAGMKETGSVLESTVLRHDEQYHLTELGFAGGVIMAPKIERPIGSHVRVKIPARDVSLALQYPRQTSVLNIFEGSVVEIASHDPAYMMVSVKIGGNSILLSRVTKKSAESLDLKPGRLVVAMVKSAVLDV